MASKKKTFREKLADSKDYPRVQPLTGKMAERFGAGTILIPAPLDVDALMRKVQRGKRFVVQDFEQALAQIS